jgi:hypothetical protein
LNAEREALVRARAEQIAAWWAAGETMYTIKDRLGWSVDHLGREMNHIRGRWPDLLPHRRTPEQRERIRAGRWGEKTAA